MTEQLNLARLPDWRGRLTAYLAEVAHRPFRPGKHDCALFVAGAVQAMTGHDFAKGWRGYRTLEEGQSALAGAGFEDHVAFAAAQLPEVAPSLSRVGDVAVLPADAGFALGIVQGEQVFAVHPRGLVTASRLEMVRAFRV